MFSPPSATTCGRPNLLGHLLIGFVEAFWKPRAPYRHRTPGCAVKGRRPGPLDEGRWERGHIDTFGRCGKKATVEPNSAGQHRNWRTTPAKPRTRTEALTISLYSALRAKVPWAKAAHPSAGARSNA